MLLRCLLNDYFVIETAVDENSHLGESPANYVLRLGKEKALAVGDMQELSIKDGVVIAADTIVVDQNQLLGKPMDSGHARQILQQLRAKTHQVLSGISVFQMASQTITAELVSTDVTMRNYTDQEIEDYINSGDPFDKAGAYGIQNETFNPAPEFDGCFANVMGLPLCHLARMMSLEQLELLDGVAQRCQATIDYDCPVFSEILSGEIG
jgi:MAF protein